MTLASLGSMARVFTCPLITSWFGIPIPKGPIETQPSPRAVDSAAHIPRMTKKKSWVDSFMLSLPDFETDNGLRRGQRELYLRDCDLVASNASAITKWLRHFSGPNGSGPISNMARYYWTAAPMSAR